MYNKDTEIKVEKILSVLNEQVNNTETEFKRKINYIINQADARTYDVSELNGIIQMVKDVREISDETYATYEMSIRTLDVQCDELEKEGLSHKNLHDIVYFMKNVNKKSSDITNNFSISFDRVAAGDIGTMSYIASMEAKAIEKKWEMKYSLHEESDEEKQERIRQDQENLEAKARERENKEQIKKNAQAQMEAEMDAWNTLVNECNTKRKEEKDVGYKEIEESAAKRKEVIASEYTKRKDDLNVMIKQNQQSLENHRQELATLGVLKFGRKKELNSIIQQEEQKDIELKTEITKADKKYNNELIENNKWISKAKSELDNSIDKKYPIPENPQARKEREEKERREKEQRENLFKGEDGKIRKLILDHLRAGRAKSISDMRRDEYELGGYSREELSKLLKELEQFGYVEHAVVKGTTYYAALK